MSTHGRAGFEVWIYLAAAGLSTLAVTIMTRLWQATWSVPFFYSGDAVASASYFKTVLGTGWYESQPALGVPYGQHYHDYPFSDELQPMMIKVFGLFSHSWPVVFNLYYIAGFPLAALTAVWFLRRCDLSQPLAVVLSALYAVAPYHFWRNESHFFLGEYWAVPLGLGVVLTVLRGDPIWGRRLLPERLGRLPQAVRSGVSWLTGRGAGTVLAVTLVTLDGAYYGVFTAVLLAPAGILALIRTRNWRRFRGAVVAGVVLGVVFVGAMVPDIVYGYLHGSNAAAFVRRRQDAETFALKFTSLILPADGHPIPALARVRRLYDTHYPLSGEEPALGLMGAIGFLLLLGLLLVVLAVRRRPEATDPVRVRRRETFYYLSALTWLAFLLSTIGGFGTLISFLTAGIRGWNRMSIVLNLFALAGLGVAIQGAFAAWDRRRTTRSSPAVPRFALPVVLVVVLVLGVFDQTSSRGRPIYDDPSYRSDDAFVQALQARVPSGSMIFQTPYLAFPEGGRRNGAIDSDQIKLFLHSSTLRWSGGGIKGRPQTEWPKAIAAEAPSRMTKDLATVGFVGIVVDRVATVDDGAALEKSLAPYTGAPTLISRDGRWAFLSLDRSLQQVAATMTAAERSAAAAVIVRAAG
ncbi:phosphoglycerol transferase [Nakamurella sp. UYEF19]|uniref:hypothetical protein n=1 Tax=Nakamurella sp. UYEF19 TaxID=1756392 RepID=UPI0033920B03